MIYVQISRVCELESVTWFWLSCDRTPVWNVVMVKGQSSMDLGNQLQIASLDLNPNLIIVILSIYFSTYYVIRIF